MLVALLVVVFFFLLVCFFNSSWRTLEYFLQGWQLSITSALAELFLGIGVGTSETFLS